MNNPKSSAIDRHTEETFHNRIRVFTTTVKADLRTLSLLGIETILFDWNIWQRSGVHSGFIHEINWLAGLSVKE
jgi:hypothetical protein